MSMTVRADMLNGHKTCHGGFILPWPTAHLRLPAILAMHRPLRPAAPSITWHLPLKGCSDGSRRRGFLAGRTGVYDIEVVNQNDKRIALFRGRSYRLNGTVLGGLKKITLTIHTL